MRQLKGFPIKLKEKIAFCDIFYFYYDSPQLSPEELNKEIGCKVGCRHLHCSMDIDKEFNYPELEGLLSKVKLS